VPVRSQFLPGATYLHDLSVMGGVLHGNSVGQNAIVRIGEHGAERVWWPLCIEVGGRPIFSRNHIQLNSIAGGPDVSSSYFTASTDRITSRVPGHRNFPVDKRGVLFSGLTREPVVRGLTRPHTARLHDGSVWLDNSGYGEFGAIEGENFVPVVRLPGWTRGLTFHRNVAFVGTSRVIPRYRQYAPGLETETSLCGVHAVDTASGRVLGSVVWPAGNQIFALDWIAGRVSYGFPFQASSRNPTRDRDLFFRFVTAK